MVMAGVQGFEPWSARVRVWSLTAWPYPNKVCMLRLTII